MIGQDSKKENVVLKIKSITHVFIHFEKYTKFDDECTVKQINYSTSFVFNVKPVSSLLEFINHVENESTCALIKSISSHSIAISELSNIAENKQENDDCETSIFCNYLYEKIKLNNTPL